MPTDDQSNALIMKTSIAAVGAAMGGGIAAMTPGKMTRKQVMVCMMSSLTLGPFTSAAVASCWPEHVPWPVAGLIGTVIGIVCLSIVQGIQKIGKMFEKKPQAFIPNKTIKDALDSAERETHND